MYRDFRQKYELASKQLKEKEALLKKLEENKDNKKIIEKTMSAQPTDIQKSNSTMSRRGNYPTKEDLASGQDSAMSKTESMDNSQMVENLLNMSDVQSVISFSSTAKGSNNSEHEYRSRSGTQSSRNQSRMSRSGRNEMKELELEIDNYKKQIKNINLLLKESEAENTRLDHQANILKEEVRRYQRNQERKEDIHNLEYLKNVIVRFIKSGPGDEKKQLLPVIDMMLKLNSGEKELLEKIATGELEEKQKENNKSSSTPNRTWSYVPRW